MSGNRSHVPHLDRAPSLQASPSSHGDFDRWGTGQDRSDGYLDRRATVARSVVSAPSHEKKRLGIAVPSLRKDDHLMKVDLEDIPFGGKSASFAMLTTARSWPSCNGCGSSLGGRYQATVTSPTIAGVAYDVFRCGCGRGRRIRRTA